MKKIFLGLAIAILAAILALIAIFAFNPFDLRTKLIGSIINSYLSSQIKDYKPLDTNNTTTGASSDVSATSDQSSVQDKNPLLSESQEATLENLGVDVSKLPTEITPSMQECFTEKLGAERAAELVAGASPSALDVIKAGGCLSL
jgi:hypothetical protein